MNILSDKIVTTRKAHTCSACGRTFETGTKMRMQVNTLDGIQTWKECTTCQILLFEFRSFFEDGDNICHEFCVNENLKKGQTPEMILNELKQLK